MDRYLNATELAYRGRIFDVHRDNVTLPNGTTIDLDVIRHPGAAAIVALTEKHDVRLIKQYRHAVSGWIWEVPAGIRDGDEAPGECAVRELREEAGLAARSWDELGEITPVPGYSDERIHLFLARDLEDRPQSLDDDEVLEVHDVPLERVLTMIDDGEIQDGKTVAALLRAARYLEQE